MSTTKQPDYTNSSSEEFSMNISDQKINEIYLATRDYIKEASKNNTVKRTSKEIIQSFSHEFSLKLYESLCEYYGVKKDRKVFKSFRKSIREFLFIAAAKKYRNEQLVTKITQAVIRPFERRTILPAALKLSGKVEDIHHKILDIFDAPQD